MANGNGNKRTAFDMRNQTKIDTTVISLADYNAKVAAFENHVATATTNAHIIENISGLQAALDGKVNVGGYTGTITVVTGVDFVGQSVTTKTITVSNGVITTVV